jgi:hypothetical protein
MSVSLLVWLIEVREQGRRVVSVDAAEMPDQYGEPVVPGLEELLVPAWTWLVARPHPWRRQLWLKGRRITAGDLGRTTEIEGWSPEQAAAQFELPVEAVLEAQRYLALNRDLVVAEERENALAASSVSNSLSA